MLLVFFPDFNPCTVDTSLCTIETGQYCVANDSIVAGYTCECRDYDGFVETADGSCEGEKGFYIIIMIVASYKAHMSVTQ